MRDETDLERSDGASPGGFAGVSVSPPRHRARRRARRRVALASLVLFVVFASGLAAIPACTTGPAQTRPAVVWLHDSAQAPSNAAPSDGGKLRPPTSPGVLRVASLNLAHGRAESFNQAFLRTATIEANLDAAGALLRREAPHIAALQEADGRSIWSGRFDHVERVARAGGFRRHLHGEHVSGGGVRYGTALVSVLELGDPLSLRFEPSWPTFNKGFVVASVPWPGDPNFEVDVVSVHLDFSRASVRRRQVDELATALEARTARPRIIVGDFNSGWDDEEDALQRLTKRLDLTTWAPEEELVTFPGLGGHRLDWVMVSPGLRVTEHRILEDDIVSDHRVIVATIARE